MKAILMSIKPRFAQLILGKTKTIEIRKRFPKDYVGWVYIYHTKAKNPNEWLIPAGAKRTKENDCSGKVIARFWCDNVEEIKMNLGCDFFTKTLNEEEIKKQACLNTTQLEEYLFTKIGNFKCAYAIHISQLEIFDTPKELNEFYGYTDKKVEWYTGLPKVRVLTSLKKAPQSWQYIEVKE